MFYGVVKKISGSAQEAPTSTEEAAAPVEADEAPTKIPASRTQALQWIAEGVEKVIDGLGQFARCVAREEAQVVVDENMREQAIAEERGFPGAG